MMAKQRRFRPRKQLRFWLYTDLESDSWMLEIIAYWKARKQFATKIKDGLRLMWSLGQGQLDVLFELFPQIEHQLIAKYSPPTAPDTDKLERDMAEIKKLILESGSIQAPPKDYPSMKPVTVPLPALPKAEVKAAAMPSASEIADNFLAFLQ